MQTSKQPFVTLIIPVYNSQRYLSRCLDSILSQSYTDFEIICIDDGSTDRSGELLDGYQRQYPGKVFVKHQANAGIATTRNRGIAAARGTYLAFVDNDDWLDADYLKTLTDLIEPASPADIICSGYRRPDEDGRIVTECCLDENGEWSPYLIGAPWAKLYRSAFIRESGLSFLDTNIGEDLPFVIPAAHAAKKRIVSPYCGYNWYYNTQSVSNTIHKNSNGLQFEKTLNKLLVSMTTDDASTDPIATRYLIRLIGWYLFYTRKGDGLKTSMEQLRYYEHWLDDHINSWRKCPLAALSSPTGDPLSNRVAVWLLARHPVLFRLLLTFYVKAQ